MNRLGRRKRKMLGRIMIGGPWLNSIAAEKPPAGLVPLRKTFDPRVLEGKSILSRERFIIINDGLKNRLAGGGVLSAEDKKRLENLKSSITQKKGAQSCSNEDKVRGNVLLQKIGILLAGRQRRLYRG